jgi:hypothetical protein
MTKKYIVVSSPLCVLLCCIISLGESGRILPVLFMRHADTILTNYPSQDIVRITNSTRKGYVEYPDYLMEMRNIYDISVRKFHEINE